VAGRSPVGSALPNPCSNDHVQQRPCQECQVSLAGFAEPIAPIRSSAPIPSRLAVLLNGQLKYLTNTWTPPTSYPNQEIPIRSAGSAALALAITVQTQVWDPTLSGVPNYVVSRDRTTKIVTDLSAAHRATTAGGWGGTWQSALWAWLAGLAGWVNWRYLPALVREQVLGMLVNEATARVAAATRYLRAPDGTILTPGDSGAEENAWNALAPTLAYAMMPTHPDAPTWLQRAAELCAASYCHPDDVTAATVVSGRPISAWIAGSNVETDYTVVNHNITHPDYVAAAHLLTWSAATLSLAGRPVPRVFLWNVDKVFAALSTPLFAGKSMYIPGEPTPIVFYPQGGDWGTRRPTNFAAFDIGVRCYGMDGLSLRPAGYWADVHVNDADVMQQRFSDGHLVASDAEDNYGAREQWNAAQLAVAWLTDWLRHHGRIRITDSASLT
jgi:hypothetical protein